MIGFLRGILLEKDAPYLLIENQGLGYEVQIPLSDLTNLPAEGKEIALYIHLVKREDGDYLYGFTNKEQRTLFRTLIKVNSIGPKMALAILSNIKPAQFVSHLINNDATALEQLPGIGAKTAKRLLVEMKDKITQWDKAQLKGEAKLTNTMDDAIQALTTLGYKQHEVKLVFQQLPVKDLSSEELIKLALKNIK